MVSNWNLNWNHSVVSQKEKRRSMWVVERPVVIDCAPHDSCCDGINLVACDIKCYCRGPKWRSTRLLVHNLSNHLFIKSQKDAPLFLVLTTCKGRKVRAAPPGTGYCVCFCDLCFIKSQARHLLNIDQSPVRSPSTKAVWPTCHCFYRRKSLPSHDGQTSIRYLGTGGIPTIRSLVFRQRLDHRYDLTSHVWFTGARGATFVISLTNAALCFLSSLWSLEEDMRLVTGARVADMVMTVETKEELSPYFITSSLWKVWYRFRLNESSHVVTRNLFNSAKLCTLESLILLGESACLSQPKKTDPT